MTDEANFRAQAAFLAEALRQADIDQASASASATTAAVDTYRQLCFDDPVVSSADCQALAKALLAVVNNNKLALSNRLEQGVAHICQRQGQANHSSNDQTESTNHDHSLLPPTISNNNDDATGYSLLAWTIYGHLPLLILMSDHLAQALAFMGSFRAPDNVGNPDDDRQEAWQKMEQQQQQQQSEPSNIHPPVPTNSQIQPAPHGDDQDTLHEVWAAESDPSDYDFGSEQQRMAELDIAAWSHLFSVEPHELSQPSPDTTWLHVADTLTYLWQRLKYSSVLSGMNMATWKQWQISEKLTQSCLALLLPFTLQSTPLLSQYPPSHWQQLALQPLHAFRDAVDEHPTTALLDDYVNLLVLLLQAHETVNKTTSSAITATATNTNTSVAPATLVGLGALATLCQSALEQPQQPQRLQVVRETILRVADNLTTLLEIAVVTSDPVVPWTFLSLWTVLSSQHELSQPQAQILLQSGLIQQWMLTWQGQKDGSPLRLAMERSILHLACAAPTTIGKYAWRFVNFAATVTTMELSNNNNSIPPSDLRFLWNLVGSYLAETAGGSVLVSLKQTSRGAPAARPAPSATQCQEQAWNTFQNQCQGIVQALSAWKDRRNEATTTTMGDENDAAIEEDIKAVFDSFHALVDAMSIPLARKLFLEKMVKDFDVTSNLAPIRKILVSWPSPQSHEDTKENVADETPKVSSQPAVKAEKPTSDDDDDEDPMRPKRRRGRVEVEDEIVAALRRTMKVLQSTLESADQTTSTRFSSKAD